MSFFTSLESHRKKILARLDALNAHEGNTKDLQKDAANPYTSKKQLDNYFRKYVNKKFEVLLAQLTQQPCLAHTISADCLCNFKPTEVRALDDKEIKEAIDAARKKDKEDRKNPPQKTPCEADALHFLTDNLIRMNADSISIEDKEQICKVLMKLFKALDAFKNNPDELPATVNALLETNKSLYGTPSLHVINTAVLVIGLAVLTAGLLLMITGFGFPIGIAVYAIAGVTMAAGAGGMIGGYFGIGKHSNSSSVVPSTMREAAEKLNPRPKSK